MVNQSAPVVSNLLNDTKLEKVIKLSEAIINLIEQHTIAVLTMMDAHLIRVKDALFKKTLQDLRPIGEYFYHPETVKSALIDEHKLSFLVVQTVQRRFSDTNKPDQ